MLFSFGEYSRRPLARIIIRIRTLTVHGRAASNALRVRLLKARRRRSVTPASLKIEKLAAQECKSERTRAVPA
ncbi:hypothetical protein EVAR_95751_1 [Eumeta japonica]|uniref:Uncharacterized protein n=1 Tax=Eumeta variegata TaxID=151549 RepID=A0A4C1UKL4_EUMVA|nr:hypothetical protein EVAR_95751_1 [Eumeta japonica]